MSLENEYYHFKQELRSEKKELEKFESLDMTQMDERELEARNRGIKSCKESINELEELIDEIKSELKEFIKNDGEVSALTIAELQENENSSSETIKNDDKMEESEKFVEFMIVSKKNENIKLSGCVDINTIDDDEPDFEYADSQGFYTPQRHWDIQAETSWKLDEKERLNREHICNKIDADVCGDYTENAQCLWDFQDENKTIERDSYYLIINNGEELEY